MRLIYRGFCTVGLILVVLFIAGTVARIIGARERISPLAALFTRPDGTPCGKPCLLGVTSSQNRLTAMEHPLLLQSTDYLVLQSSGWGPIRVHHQADGGKTFSTVGLPSLARAFTVGDLIQLVGQPTAISIHRHPAPAAQTTVERFALDFATARLCAVVEIDYPQATGARYTGIVPDLPLSSISLQTDALDSDCGFYTRYQWRGFLSFARYRDYIPR